MERTEYPIKVGVKPYEYYFNPKKYFIFSL